MSSSRPDRRAVPGFHPEFGLLCPSPRRRRGLRLAMVSIATTLAVGATMGLAVAYWPDGEGPAATAQPVDEQPPAGALDSPVNSTQRSVSAADVDASPVTRVQKSCKAGATGNPKDLAALFLNPACGSTKLHARHGARATNRVATVILGRTDAPPALVAATPTRVAVAAIKASQVTAGVAAGVASGVTAGSAEKSTNSTTPPVEPAAPPPKKPKTASGATSGAPIALTPPARELSQQNTMVNAPMFNAYAATPRFGREFFDPYNDASHSTAPQKSFDARFGRFW